MIRLVLVVLALAAAGLAAAGTQTLAPNELGRVMILEYHKIDYPEERWTRTPENSAAIWRPSTRADTGCSP